jgi:hypothetical protein
LPRRQLLLLGLLLLSWLLLLQLLLLAEEVSPV